MADLDPMAEGGRIAPLGSLDDFEVAEDFPDPRGWDVVLADGNKIGEIEELIVDTQALRTRYLDVDLDKDAVGLTEDKHVLIPVGAARLDDDRDDVIVDLDIGQIAAMPAYDQSMITRDYENSIVGGFRRSDDVAQTSTADQDFYSHQSFDDSRFYGNRWRQNRDNLGTTDRDEARITRAEEELAIGKRRVQAGEVNVEKQVETEHISEPVSVRREEVTVERRPIEEGRTAANATIGEDEIRVPVTEEEVIVEKRPVVKEEIVIRKHAVEDTKEVEADVRKERVEVDDNTTRRDLNR
jgi:photosynthetic reaction center H subunit